MAERVALTWNGRCWRSGLCLYKFTQTQIEHIWRNNVLRSKNKAKPKYLWMGWPLVVGVWHYPHPPYMANLTFNLTIDFDSWLWQLTSTIDFDNRLLRLTFTLLHLHLPSKLMLILIRVLELRQERPSQTACHVRHTRGPQTGLSMSSFPSLTVNAFALKQTEKSERKMNERKMNDKKEWKGQNLL